MYGFGNAYLCTVMSRAQLLPSIFPHERILSVAADQLLLADYLFGAGD